MVNAVKNSAIVVDIQVAAATIAATAASWARTAALNAESIALTVKNALSGPLGWAVLAAAAASAGSGFALAIPNS